MTKFIKPGQNLTKLVKTCQIWSKLVKIGQNLSNLSILVKTYQNCTKIVKICKYYIRVSKVVKTCLNLAESLVKVSINLSSIVKKFVCLIFKKDSIVTLCAPMETERLFSLVYFGTFT